VLPNPTDIHAADNNATVNPGDDDTFGRVVTMESDSFNARVYVAVTDAKRKARAFVESGDFEGLECPAILGPEILDIIEAADVLRAKLDDHDLCEYLTDEQRKVARRVLAGVEMVRGDMLALTRDGDLPEDGTRAVIG
jgi:hypothetical protein